MKKKKEVVDPKVKIEETIMSLEEFVRRSEIKRKTLLEKAKTAKARGDKMNYSMAVNALRVIMQQQKRAEQMVLSMEIVTEYKDASVMMNSMMECMQTACVEMGSLPNMKKMKKVASDFNASIGKMNDQNMALDEYMSALSDSLSDSDFEGVSTSDEIGQMIERELATELDTEDLEIAREIEEAQKRV